MAQKRFLKGLFKDTPHIDQPQDTWRYAKNAIINEKKGSISNEGGTDKAGQIGGLSIFTRAIGVIEVTNDKAIIFYLNNIGHSAIGKWEDGSFEDVYIPNITAHGDKVDLKFNKHFPIEGTFNINPQGQLIVYWTDDLNPPRALNITLQLNGNPEFIYDIDPSNSHDNHIDLLNLFPNSGPVPHVDLLEISQGPNTYQNAVKEGGGLLTGVYYLSLAYVDDSFTATNFLTMSNPISIVDEGDHTRPTTKKDGAPSGSQTSKSITWNVTNMNTDYKFIRPVIIRRMGEATDAYRLNDVEVPTAVNNINITFSGIEGFSPTSLEDVIIDTISYETAKTINQLDGVLYVGNTTGTKDLGYQKYANNIKLTAHTKTFNKFDTNILSVDNLETGFAGYPVDSYGSGSNVQNIDHSQSYRYAPNIFKYKGYMRDEVYAFYIAFVLKDGSMSYAYHIPGREHLAQDTAVLDNEGWDNDFEKLSPSYIRKFHLYDSSTDSQYNMNYWENATELYPNTDNFEVWNENGQLPGASGSIKGKNVRHHHFPSNGNPDYKTIHESSSKISLSAGINLGSLKEWASSGPPYTVFTHTSTSWGAMELDYGGSAGSYGISGPNNTGNWFTVRWTGNANPIAINAFDEPAGMAGMTAALWKQDRYLVADQPMTVTVKYLLRLKGSNNCPTDHKSSAQLVHETAAGIINIVEATNGQVSNNWYFYADFGSSSAPAPTVNMDVGDKLYFRVRHEESDCTGYHFRYLQPTPTSIPTGNYLWFEITVGSNQYLDSDLTDVKLEHKVKALGFKLSDIKIPQDIADKVQGFRIYRAKRGHEDRRILGQGPLTAMTPDHTVLGRCSETAASIDANEILSTTGSLREMVYHKSSFMGSRWDQLQAPILYNYVSCPSSGSPSYSNSLNGKEAYKAFSFNDFHLLRTQNSLAGATHIKPEYKVFNFVWNGPTQNQERKMLSKIIEDDGGGNYSEPIRKIEQFWGWDTEYNCYSKEVKTAIFAGCHYQAANSIGCMDPNTNELSHLSAPRLIGQKAKTYLPGDSIYQGAGIGFGAKVANEFGESTIILSLEDGHEVAGDKLISNRNDEEQYQNGPGYSGLSSVELGNYASYNLNAPSILVNKSIWNLDPYANYSYASNEEKNMRRSQVLMVNLHAFKTDVYKSIDNQELIWTGFEVLGDDLDFFVIDSGVATYNTDSVNDDGIFGGDTYICRYGFRSSLTHNSVERTSIPEKAIHYHIVENVDNINFRHTENDESLYFPGSIAKRVLELPGDKDLTHQDNLKYDMSFSYDNDLRPAFPLPIKITEQTEFPNRAHRSVRRDNTSLTDNYRLFLANEFKDVPKNRGELWKLSTFNNLLYFHMEESLYVTKGKQQMQMKDGSEAFVGSGDIFAQEPDEILQADKGYGGTQSQWAALTCNQGYFFVDVNSRKIFLMKDSLIEISSLGMENWFKDNLPFNLEQYSYGAPCISRIFDNPLVGLGLTSAYDPKFKRIILTKKDLKPTDAFKNGWKLYLTNQTSNGLEPYIDGQISFDCEIGQYIITNVDDNPGGQNTYTHTPLDWEDLTYFTPTGWTISFYPEFQVWCGFHDYMPYMYFSTSDNFYSIPSWELGFGTGHNYIWKHNDGNKGSFYNVLDSPNKIYSFELEYIHNEYREESTLLSSFDYALETTNSSNVSVLEHGFTSFFIYNTFQIFAEEVNNELNIVVPTALEYLVNVRKVGKSWKVNNFRDMANIALNNTAGGYYMSTNTNILGGVNTGTITTSSTESMFIIDGMSEIINPNYINTTKQWHERRKFIDKWAGIRLIYNNLSNNLLNLYSASAAVRKTYK